MAGLREGSDAERTSLSVGGDVDRYEVLLDLTSSYPFVVDVLADRSMRMGPVGHQLAEAFGFAAEALEVPDGWAQLVHPDDRGEAAHALQEAVTTGHVVAEVRMLTSASEVRWVRFHVALEDGGPTSRLVGVAHDITDSRRSADVTAQLSAIVTSSDDAIIGKTLDGVITSWNLGAERLYGYSPAEMIGRHINAIACPGGEDEFDDILRRVKRGDPVAHMETVRQRKDGSPVDVSVTVSPVRDASGTIVAAATIARDISERRSAEREREAVIGRIFTAQRQERVRVARELHDGLGQVLTSASLMVASAEAEAADASTDVPSLQALGPLLDEAMEATRTLVWRLRPAEIETEGFTDAIDTLAEKLRVRHKLAITTHVAGMDGGLSTTVQTTAFRVVQEATTNAIRHAKAGTISIVATRLGPQVVVVVEDDGCGFDPAAPGRGAGLMGMQERVADAGGSLAVESQPGSGTIVRARLPVLGRGLG